MFGRRGISDWGYLVHVSQQHAMRATKEEILAETYNVFERWLHGATSDELGWLLRKNLQPLQRDLLLIEISNRGKKEHWSLAWAFWVLCITAVFAGIAAWPIVRDWIWPKPLHYQAELAQPPRKIETYTPTPIPPIATVSPLPQATLSSSSTPTAHKPR
jgi:hypothetical protein